MMILYFVAEIMPLKCDHLELTNELNETNKAVSKLVWKLNELYTFKVGKL